jgi:hypothetical protein
MNKMLLAVVCLGMIGSANMFAEKAKGNLSADEASNKKTQAEIILGVVTGEYNEAWNSLKADIDGIKEAKKTGDKMVTLMAVAKASVPAQTLMSPVKFIVEKVKPAMNMISNAVKKGSKLGDEIEKMVGRLSEYIDSLAELGSMFA